MDADQPAAVGSDGIWSEVPRPAETARLEGRPALFLDRDGVVVAEVDFLRRPEDLKLIEGAAALIAAANARALAVVLISNQSGVGRGLLGWRDFAAVQARLAAELAMAGARLDMVLACPFHPQAKPPHRHPDHPDRKPNPGMLLRAGRRLGLDLARSWVVGDRARDLAAGRAAGLAGGLLVATGYGGDPAEQEGAKALVAKGFSVVFGASIAAAEDLVRRVEPPAQTC